MNASNRKALGGPLTPAQKQVRELALKGWSAKRIAQFLVRSEGTVRDHLKAIYANAKVAGRGELLSREIERLRGLLDTAVASEEELRSIVREVNAAEMAGEL